MRYLYSIIALLFSSTFLAQSYNMSNTAVSTCSGTFYDSGGAGSNYGYGQNFTKTFCPSTPGSRIQFNFTSFSLENAYDFMTIYDGNSTAAPTLGTYTGAIGPGLVQASNGNASGCLTFVFTSDGSFFFPSTMAGWSATIACLPDCQTTVPAFTTVPAAVAGIVKVCLGASVTFNAGSTTYPINNTGYTQSNATTTFNWNFGNGATGTGISPTVTYAAPGIYIVRVNTVDVQGCTNTIIPQITVEVAAASIMTGSFVTSPTICLGQTNTLTGAATPQTVSLNCTPSTPVVVFLPDGAGASYSSPIAVNCFAGRCFVLY